MNHDANEIRSEARIIDLSVGLENDAVHEPMKPVIEYWSHATSGGPFISSNFGVDSSELPGDERIGPAGEQINAMVHTGTHVDAPWHYSPVSEGKPSRTIDQLPLEWFYSDGVRLDFRHKRGGEKISVTDLEEALNAIGYALKPLDIVLIWSGLDKQLGTTSYFDQPGLTAEATIWLVDQGVKVIAVDMYSLDRSFNAQAREAKETGDNSGIWEAHFAGIEREYCQVEKLANLDELPAPTGFKVAVFPIKIKGGSAGWTRAVAIVPPSNASTERSGSS